MAFPQQRTRSFTDLLGSGPSAVHDVRPGSHYGMDQRGLFSVNREQLHDEAPLPRSLQAQVTRTREPLGKTGRELLGDSVSSSSAAQDGGELEQHEDADDDDQDTGNKVKEHDHLDSGLHVDLRWVLKPAKPQPLPSKRHHHIHQLEQTHIMEAPGSVHMPRDVGAHTNSERPWPQRARAQSLPAAVSLGPSTMSPGAQADSILRRLLPPTRSPYQDRDGTRVTGASQHNKRLSESDRGHDQPSRVHGVARGPLGAAEELRPKAARSHTSRTDLLEPLPMVRSKA